MLSPPFYVCNDDECRAIAKRRRLGAYIIPFTVSDPRAAYEELLDETAAALGEMHCSRLCVEARKAAPFICSHETHAQLSWYRRGLLDVFHQHGCLTFLRSVPRKPHNLFKPRFLLTIEDEAGATITDVRFDSMLSYADVFGVPRKSLYRSEAHKSRRSKTTRQYSVRVDMVQGEDPLTTPEGIALLKKVQNDPLTKDAPGYVQENSVRFYLAGLLDQKNKPLTGSEKRAEARMLKRRAEQFSGKPVLEDAPDEQPEQTDSTPANGQDVNPAPTPDGDYGHDDSGA